MVREPEVVIGAEAKDATASDADLGALRARNALRVSTEAGGLECAQGLLNLGLEAHARI
jgi:NAD(P)H-nitrite reductase large subunit